jgi:hypothetical protein
MNFPDNDNHLGTFPDDIFPRLQHVHSEFYREISVVFKHVNIYEETTSFSPRRSMPERKWLCFHPLHHFGPRISQLQAALEVALR